RTWARIPVAALLVLGELAAQSDQTIEPLAGRAAIDRARGQLDALREIARLRSRDEGRRGVEQDDVPARPSLTVEDRPDHLRVLLTITAAQIADGRAREPDVLGPHLEGPHDALAHLGDTARARVRDLVETVGAVDDERAERPQLREDAGQRLGERRRRDA